MTVSVKIPRASFLFASRADSIGASGSSRLLASVPVKTKIAGKSEIKSRIETIFDLILEFRSPTESDVERSSALG